MTKHEPTQDAFPRTRCHEYTSNINPSVVHNMENRVRNCIPFPNTISNPPHPS